jgi:hypothetical protein
MWPMVVAMNFGGFLRTSLEVSPGKPVTWFMSSAVKIVERAGENRAACAKATSSAGDAGGVGEGDGGL